MSNSFMEDPEFQNTSTGVPIPKIIFEARSLSSKKCRERNSLRYIPPAPRPHYVRSAPSQTRLLHSRNDSHDLDNSFHYLMNSLNHSGNNGNAGPNLTFFRQFFDIQERLGFGSFGDVYRVKSKIDNKEYAIKKSRRTYSGEGDRSRQLREVQRVVNIPPNEHMVCLDRAWEEEGFLYIQMELLSKSLTQEIEDGHYLNESETWDLFIDMLFALQHLHTHHLVHMDVKPDNIFLTIDSPIVYKLGDFGIVVSLDEKKDVVEFTEGDSRYLAPEVMEGKISTKADVFSLGLTLLEVVCSVDLPKGGELWHTLRSGESLPDPCPREMPESLHYIIKWMISPDIQKRPEVKDLLELSAVKSRIRKRKWRLTTARIFKKITAVTRFLHRFLAYLTSLMFFKTSKKVDNNSIVCDHDQMRVTPEPFPMEGDVPSIILNDNSFSDDEDMQIRGRGTPVFASTPIPTSKTKSSGRLRSSKRNTGEGEFRAMGSPTSRNLLREFEAVSD